MYAGTRLQIEVLGEHVGDPIGNLNPQPFHVVLVLTFLYYLIPRLRIYARVQVHALRFDSGLERLAAAVCGC